MYKRKYMFLEIINLIYFCTELFVLVCKFGIIFDKIISQKIFNIFYYWCSIPIFAISFIMTILFLINSKKRKNYNESEEYVKNTIACISTEILSFQFITAMSGSFSIKKISLRWFQLIVYLTIILSIVNFLVYVFVRKISINSNTYKQKETINKYIIYAIIVSILFGVIIPNLMLHFGIIDAIKNY